MHAVIVVPILALIDIVDGMLKVMVEVPIGVGDGGGAWSAAVRLKSSRWKISELPRG
jgi:hypothetical protein